MIPSIVRQKPTTRLGHGLMAGRLAAMTNEVTTNARPAMTRSQAKASTASGPPGRRGHRIVADGDLENRCRNGHRWNDRPWTVPARADAPSIVGEAPVLVGVEENIHRSPGRIVDRHSGDNDEGGWSREWEPDLDAHLGLNRH